MTQSRSFSSDTLAEEYAAKSVVITTAGLTVTTALVEYEIVRHCFFREQVDSVQILLRKVLIKLTCPHTLDHSVERRDELNSCSER